MKKKIKNCLNDILWKAAATGKDFSRPDEIRFVLENGKPKMIQSINPEKQKLYNLLTFDWEGVYPTKEFFERYQQGRTYGEMILAYEKEAKELSEKSKTHQPSSV